MLRSVTSSKLTRLPEQHSVWGGFLKERAYSTGAEAFSVKSYTRHPRSGITKEFHLKQYTEMICRICICSHIKNCLNRNRIMKENLQSSRLLAQVTCKWASPCRVLVEEYRILSSVSLQEVEQGKDFENRLVHQKVLKISGCSGFGAFVRKKKATLHLFTVLSITPNAYCSERSSVMFR